MPAILGSAEAVEFHRRGAAAKGASLRDGEATAERARRAQHLDARAIVYDEVSFCAGDGPGCV